MTDMTVLSARSLAVRSSNKDLKRELACLPRAEACKRAADIVRWPIDNEEALRVGHLVQSVPMIGDVKFGTWASRNRVPRERKLRDLTKTQRDAVAGWLLLQARMMGRRR